MTRLHWVRTARYRWSVADCALLTIPLAAVLLAAAGRLLGWQ